MDASMILLRTAMKEEQTRTPTAISLAPVGSFESICLEPRLTCVPCPAPLQLSQADALSLLTPEEQELCSTLKMLPRPYLVIKETFIVENARRGGMLRRKDAK